MTRMTSVKLEHGSEHQSARTDWAHVVEMDICAASPGPDSLTLRGSVEPARTLLKEHLNAPGQLWTIYGHREHMD